MKRWLAIVWLVAYMAFSSVEFAVFARNLAISTSVPMMPNLLPGVLATASALLCGLCFPLPVWGRNKIVLGVRIVLLLFVLFFVLRWSGILASALPPLLRMLEIRCPAWVVHAAAFLAGYGWTTGKRASA
ncbi:MAG: hypothetical protein Q3Y08_03695 [Butyricicoccus sp.]|nr:hypothetical protein [Butyricicoccus sp.]